MSESQSGGHLRGEPHLAQYARARRAGDLIFFAGISARRSDNSIPGAERDAVGARHLDIRAQTEGAIANLRAALQSVRADLQDLVDLTVLLVNMNDYGGFNEVYNRYFDTDGPTRTTFAVHQLPDPLLAIELKAIAYKPE